MTFEKGVPIDYALVKDAKTCSLVDSSHVSKLLKSHQF